MATWDNTFEGLPAGSEDRSLGDDRIRDLKTETSARASKLADWGDSSTAAGAGYADTGMPNPMIARAVVVDGTGPTGGRTTFPTTLVKPDGTNQATSITANEPGFIAADGGMFAHIWGGKADATFRGLVGALGQFNTASSTHATDINASGWSILQNSAGSADLTFDIVVPDYVADGLTHKPDQPLLMVMGFAQVQEIAAADGCAVRVMAKASGGADATMIEGVNYTDVNDGQVLISKRFMLGWFIPDPAETYTIRMEGRARTTSSPTNVCSFNEAVVTPPTGVTLESRIAAFLIGTNS